MLSYDESYSLHDKSDYDGSDYRSVGTCASPFCFEESVGHVDDSVGRIDDSVGRVGDSIDRVCGVGYNIFFLTVIKSISDVVTLVVFVPI